MSVARASSVANRRLADLVARERSARHQAEQWQQAGRQRTARDIRQHADRLREMRQGAKR